MVYIKHMEKGESNTGPCTRCGEQTDNKLADVFVCEECYQIRSSCCPEFGPDDLAEKVCEKDSELTTKSTENSEEE